MYITLDEPATRVWAEGKDRSELVFSLESVGRVTVPVNPGAMDDLARIVDGWRAAGTVPGKPEPVCDHCHGVVWPCAFDDQLEWRHKESGSWFCSDPEEMAEVAGSTRVPAEVQS